MWNMGKVSGMLVNPPYRFDTMPLDIQDPWNHLAEGYLASGRITATIYRHGAMLEGWPQRWPGKTDARLLARRGTITSQSARSLIRAAFAIRAAEVDWKYLMTLTFRERKVNHKACLRAFFQGAWRGQAQRYGIAWFLEYQERGVEHYHILLADDAMTALCWPETPEFRRVWRRGQHISVLGGDAEARVVGMWAESVVDFSEPFMAFQRGGVVEVLQNPESAHNYMASYCRKLSQKTLPEGLQHPGRWWWMSDRARPVPRGTFVVSHYPFEKPHRLVRDASDLIWNAAEIYGPQEAVCQGLTAPHDFRVDAAMSGSKPFDRHLL